MADQPLSDAEYIASLTPERAEEVASKIAEQWQRDWGLVMALVMEKTGLSRVEAIQFMTLRELAGIRSGVERGIAPKYHDGCEVCQNEKHFHELQQKALELTVRHLEDELGEDWKDGE